LPNPDAEFGRFFSPEGEIFSPEGEISARSGPNPSGRGMPPPDLVIISLLSQCSSEWQHHLSTVGCGGK